MEDWKIKISVLWLFYAVAFLVVLTLGLAEPGALDQLMAGEIGGMKITPELMLGLAILMLVPLVMRLFHRQNEEPGLDGFEKLRP